MILTGHVHGRCVLRLYHGSNVTVKEPKIIVSDRRLDFGTGFYLTTSYEQARRWAELTTARRKKGRETITVFDFDETALQRLKVLLFDKADVDWLRYAANNRNNEHAADDYDIVAGPVANDRTAPVLAAYFAGIYDEAETIKRLLPQKLRDQYAFKTEGTLAYLALSEVIEK